MTQQYSSEALAFESKAMPHGRREPLEGGDEASIEASIRASVQGGKPGPAAPPAQTKPKARDK